MHANSTKMVTRIVKMEFKPEKIQTFKELFAVVQHKIRQFEGCLHVELLQCATDSFIFFTFSHWDDATALENYRNSTLFRETWKETKKLFSNKAVAWSVFAVVND